jgi:hypothetical protein
MRARSRFLLVLGAVVAVTVAGVGAAPAMADEDPLSYLESVSQVAPAEADVLSSVATVSPTKDATEAGIASAAGVDTSFPANAVDPITLSGSHAQVAPLSIELPFAGDASLAKVDASGAVSYDNNNGSTSVAVANADGSLVVATVISDESAPTRYDYSYSLPVGGALVAEATGGVLVMDATGFPIATVEAPWAYDATGKAVPTRFEINGSTLTQIVDHSGSAYPVVADPTVNYYWWGSTTKFSRSETRDIANASGDAQVIAVVCALASGPFALACGLATIVVARVWSNFAKSAASQGKCLQINNNFAGIVFPPAQSQVYIVTC